MLRPFIIQTTNQSIASGKPKMSHQSARDAVDSRIFATFRLVRIRPIETESALEKHQLSLALYE